MQICIDLQGSFCNSWPELTIVQDDLAINRSIENSQQIQIELQNKPFSIGMLNKSFGNNNVWDTNTDSNNNIVEDKSILINSLKIDDVEFVHHLNKLDYNSIEHGSLRIYDCTIRFNGQWTIGTGENPYNWIIDTVNTHNNNNDTRKNLSYFSGYNIVGDYSAHYQVISEIRELIKQ